MEQEERDKQAIVKQALEDVYEETNWAYLAQNYFGKNRAWLYHKFSGGHTGESEGFSDVDPERLREALKDIAGKIWLAAERLEGI